MKIRVPTGLLFCLPAEQRAELVRWLLDDTPTLTYPEAKERLQRHYGVETSVRSLGAFYQWHIGQRLMETVVVGAQTTHAVAAAAHHNHSQAFEALMELSGQAAFDLRAEPGKPTLEEVQKCVEMGARGLRARNAAAFLRLKQREVALMERKYNDKLAREPRKRNPVTGNAMEIIAAKLKI